MGQFCGSLPPFPCGWLGRLLQVWLWFACRFGRWLRVGWALGVVWVWFGCGSGRWHGVGAAWHVGSPVGLACRSFFGVGSAALGWSRASVVGVGISRFVFSRAFLKSVPVAVEV